MANKAYRSPASNNAKPNSSLPRRERTTSSSRASSRRQPSVGIGMPVQRQRRGSNPVAVLSSSSLQRSKSSTSLASSERDESRARKLPIYRSLTPPPAFCSPKHSSAATRPAVATRPTTSGPYRSPSFAPSIFPIPNINVINPSATTVDEKEKTNPVDVLMRELGSKADVADATVYKEPVTTVMQGDVTLNVEVPTFKAADQDVMMVEKGGLEQQQTANNQPHHQQLSPPPLASRSTDPVLSMAPGLTPPSTLRLTHQSLSFQAINNARNNNNSDGLGLDFGGIGIGRPSSPGNVSDVGSDDSDVTVRPEAGKPFQFSNLRSASTSQYSDAPSLLPNMPIIQRSISCSGAEEVLRNVMRSQLDEISSVMVPHQEMEEAHSPAMSPVSAKAELVPSPTTGALSNKPSSPLSSSPVSPSSPVGEILRRNQQHTRHSSVPSLAISARTSEAPSPLSSPRDSTHRHLMFLNGLNGLNSMTNGGVASTDSTTVATPSSILGDENKVTYFNDWLDPSQRYADDDEVAEGEENEADKKKRPLGDRRGPIQALVRMFSGTGQPETSA